MKKLLIIALGLIGSPAFAGWASSGGIFGSDEDNPWWLPNTTTVKYCIALDETGISVQKDLVKYLFEEAVKFWQRESAQHPVFQDNHTVAVNLPFITVATQSFIYTNCDDPTVDVQLLLGKNTLDVMQREFLKDRLDYTVAMAVRTDYDKVNLRGKGFLFVNDDNFELIDWRHSQGNQVQYFRSWSHHERLLRVLIHELGHIFGVKHVPNTVMDESAPATYFKDDFFDDSIMIDGFASSEGRFASCLIDTANNAFFEFFPNSDEIKCVSLTSARYSTHVDIAGSKSQARGQIVDLGSINFEGGSRSTGARSFKIYLPSEQTVFNTSVRDAVSNISLVEFSYFYGRDPQIPGKSFHLKVSPTNVELLGTKVTSEGSPQIEVLFRAERDVTGNWRSPWNQAE